MANCISDLKKKSTGKTQVDFYFDAQQHQQHFVLSPSQTSSKKRNKIRTYCYISPNVQSEKTQTTVIFCVFLTAGQFES